MPHMHHYHLPHLFNFRFRKELSEVYIMSLIRSFACSLIGVFVPAYLINLGYSLDSLVFYYLFLAVSYGLLNLVIVKLVSRIGAKHSILLSVPPLICFLLLLNSLPAYDWSLYLISFLGALYSVFYWPALHLTFFHASDRKHRGEEYGFYEAVFRIPSIIAPFLGGLVIYFFGFQVLFYMACILFLIAPIPLFFSREVYEPFTFSFKHMVGKHNIREVAVFFFEGFLHYGEFVLWPIFIFVMLKNFLSLGVVAALGMCAAVIMAYISGRVSDVVSKRKVLRVGSSCMTVLWFFRSFASKFIHFVILTPIIGFFFTSFSVPYMALFYDKGVKHPAEFVIFREFTMHALGGSTLLLIFYFTKSFLTTFIVAGFSYFGLWLF